MSPIQEYKCPACGGKLEFDSGTQKMKCPYCDTTIDVSAFNEPADQQASGRPGSTGGGEAAADFTEDMKWETAVGGEWQAGETDGMAVFTCKSCGGEIVGDQNTGASSCPFCGNPVVMTQQFSGDLRPDYVIPFKLDKAAAKAALIKHYKGKPLLPKVFKNQNHIDEIKGVYVPFWLFDADAEADIQYRATRTRAWSDSNYNYVETSYFAAHRAGHVDFERVPVDGSNKMADDLMESIEPFNFADAVPFQTAYLSGYLADRYDVTAEQSIERANERIKRSTEEAFAATVTGYETVTPENSQIRLANGKAKYALYPVWLLNTTWHDKQYAFAMNGQTGKLVGDLPMDKGAFWKWAGILTAAYTAVAFGVLSLIWLLG